MIRPLLTLFLCITSLSVGLPSYAQDSREPADTQNTPPDNTPKENISEENQPPENSRRTFTLDELKRLNDLAAEPGSRTAIPDLQNLLKELQENPDILNENSSPQIGDIPDLTIPDEPAITAPQNNRQDNGDERNLSDPETLDRNPEFENSNTGSLNPLDQTPDYSNLTREAERQLRLDALFEKIKTQDNKDIANLTAEEIWAIWLDSGSASVNLLLRRGTAAERAGQLGLARRMYDLTIDLDENYSEGWARSARLAIVEEDLGRALRDVNQALIIEPRHFYSLWTLGNILERIGKNTEAFEAYSAAHDLYPALEAVNERLESLRPNVEGDVL